MDIRLRCSGGDKVFFILLKTKQNSPSLCGHRSIYCFCSKETKLLLQNAFLYLQCPMLNDLEIFLSLWFPPLESSSHSELLTMFWAKHSKLPRSRWTIILQPCLPSHPTSHTTCNCYKHSLDHPALRLLLKSFPLPISPYSVCPSRNSHPLMFSASPDLCLPIPS